MKRRWIAATVLAAQCIAQPAYAWDEIGHQVIARIAWENLAAPARLAAYALLTNAPEDSDLLDLLPASGTLAVRRSVFFVEASTWPDIVRDESFPQRRRKYHHGNWHYVNFFFEETPEGPRDRPDLRPDSVNVAERLAVLDKSFVDLDRPSADRAVDLAWILHLVGDIHQPLHAVARVTATEPRGDQGGNLFQLGGTNNLHSYWDGAIRRGTRRRNYEPEHTYVNRIADSIMARYPRSAYTPDQLNPGDYQAWAREGLATAKAQVYNTPRGQAPSDAYRAAAIATSERAAALAGYRLARLLNRALVGS